MSWRVCPAVRPVAEQYPPATDADSQAAHNWLCATLTDDLLSRYLSDPFEEPLLHPRAYGYFLPPEYP